MCQISIFFPTTGFFLIIVMYFNNTIQIEKKKKIA